MRVTFEGETIEDVLADIQRFAVGVGRAPVEDRPTGARPIELVLAELETETLLENLRGRLRADGMACNVVPLTRPRGRPKKTTGFEPLLKELGVEKMADLPYDVRAEVERGLDVDFSEEHGRVLGLLAKGSGFREAMVDYWLEAGPRLGVKSIHDLPDADEKIRERFVREARTVWLRAAIDKERTEKTERAMSQESTGEVERAARAESTDHPKRADVSESTEIDGRAVIQESTENTAPNDNDDDTDDDWLVA